MDEYLIITVLGVISGLLYRYKKEISNFIKYLALQCAKDSRCPTLISSTLAIGMKGEVMKCHTVLKDILEDMIKKGTKKPLCLVVAARLLLIYSKLYNSTVYNGDKGWLMERIQFRKPDYLEDAMYRYLLYGDRSVKRDLEIMSNRGSTPHEEVASFILGGELPKWCREELTNFIKCLPQSHKERLGIST